MEYNDFINSISHYQVGDELKISNEVYYENEWIYKKAQSSGYIKIIPNYFYTEIRVVLRNLSDEIINSYFN